MTLIVKTLLWGTVAGLVHFVILSVLYQNPFVAKLYKGEGQNPAVKKWKSTGKYILSMFLGTQVEIYILAFSYLFLVSFLGETAMNAFVLALVFSGIRVYPRFWNMWIQSTYPNKLLAVEVVNGVIGTFVVVFCLYFLPA